MYRLSVPILRTMPAAALVRTYGAEVLSVLQVRRWIGKARAPQTSFDRSCPARKGRTRQILYVIEKSTSRAVVVLHIGSF